MTSRLPTAAQLTLLDRVAAGEFTATEPGAYGTNQAITKAIRALIANGWAMELSSDATVIPPFRPGMVIVTAYGHHKTAQARDLADWQALPYQQREFVSITRREAARPPGRNVHCRFPGCPAAARAGISGIVWFTNEPGTVGEREAKIAAARHGMAHLRNTNQAV